MRRLLIVLVSVMFLFTLSSCSSDVDSDSLSQTVPITPGNLQNGGYVLKNQNYYLYANPDDFNNLYQKNLDNNQIKKLSGNHYFYEMNLYDGDIYYLSSSPGEIWKISLDGKNKEKICSDNVGNLIVYNFVQKLYTI